MADNWGMLPQFSSMAGYGFNSPEVPNMGGGSTSLGSPAPINYGGMETTLPTDIAGSGNGIWDGFFRSKNAQGIESGGWGSAGLGMLQGFGNAYMGMKQLGMAKDQLAFQKDTFNKNYAAQRQATNTGLQDRQSARVASNSGAYQSVGDYMNQNRIR